MSCGCKKESETAKTIVKTTKTVKTVNLPQILVPSITTKAAMCQVCPYSIKENGSAMHCSASNLPINLIVVNNTSCPKDVFIKDNEKITWKNMQWYGVPEPIRWKLSWILKRNAKIEEGCGCLVALKETKIGKYLAPWLEGIQELRVRLFNAINEAKCIITHGNC